MTSTSYTDTAMVASKQKSAGALRGLLRFVLRRGLVILVTIVIGTYLTVLVANRGGQVDEHVRREVSRQVRIARNERCNAGTVVDVEACRQNLLREMETRAGLQLSPELRNVHWTYNSLFFAWGQANFSGTVSFFQQFADRAEVKDLILSHFPNTLLIFGAADVLIFLLGIPLALHLSSRNRQYWLDRVISFIVPLSSVPSWVHGIILVAIFAVQLRILPYGGKYDNIPADTPPELIAVVAKHMILPVAAILLSMFFHLVYTWRTYFVIHADEDYLDLARAKGLPLQMLERRYILRPTMPYLLTSFALTLVGFWQMSTALEYFFNWPGLGLLYVNAIPNFWGEAFFPGEMGVVLSIVVIFAYLLGMVVLGLDVAYAWLDPRIRFESEGGGLRLSRIAKKTRKRRWSRHQTGRAGFRSPDRNLVRENAPARRKRTDPVQWIRAMSSTVRRSSQMIREMLHYPSAAIGLILLLVFLAGSLYAVIALPYAEIGSEWHKGTITGRVYTPRNVQPAWTNLFRAQDIPITQVFSSREASLARTVTSLEAGKSEIGFTIPLEYPYQAFPQDLILYMDASFEERRPHISITWVTPDGRELDLRSPTDLSSYHFGEHIVHQRFLRADSAWQEWFQLEGADPTPKHYLLFAQPGAREPFALPGTYQLQIRALTFEAGTDVDIEFVLLGGVHGFAGTDNLGRDLLVPLFWGLPFTLAFGVVGAIGTTVLAMILAAIGVWVGGWVDFVIQRLSEASMILPVLAIAILLFALYGVSLWAIIAVIILMNAFGSTTKTFRSALLQIKQAPYIESARAYGASGRRIVFRYMIPRIIPTLVPQFINLIPSLVFLEATLAIFNAIDPRFPTWGRVIFEAIKQGALWGGAQYRVLVPISLLLLIGLAFALLGFALERILNPRLQTR